MATKKDVIRQTASINKAMHVWVTQYADERGIDFTAAINILLYEAKKCIEKDPCEDCDYRETESAG